jgi:hypothetical protein
MGNSHCISLSEKNPRKIYWIYLYYIYFFAFVCNIFHVSLGARHRASARWILCRKRICRATMKKVYKSLFCGNLYGFINMFSLNTFKKFWSFHSSFHGAADHKLLLPTCTQEEVNDSGYYSLVRPHFKYAACIYDPVSEFSTCEIKYEKMWAYRKRESCTHRKFSS